MGVQFRTIPVRDANGDELTIYQVQQRSFFGFVEEWTFQLCTGEEVQQFDGDTFVVLRNGEKLIRSG